MALTPRRWLTIALLACAAVAVWLLPARGGATVIENPLGFRGRYVDGHGFARRFGWPDASTKLGAATLHLRLLQIRDSVFTRRVLAQADSGLTVLADRQYPDSIASILIAATRTAWRTSQPGTHVPVIVAFVQDTTSQLDGLPIGANNYGYAHVFRPDSEAAACRVVVRIGERLSNGNTKSARRLANWMMMRGAPTQPSQINMLGPCLLYATYGVPGPQVENWLDNTDWLAARSMAPSHASPSWIGEFQYTYHGGPMAVGMFGYPADLRWQVRSRLSDDAIACIGGATARCATGLLHGVSSMPEDSVWHQHVIDVQSYAVSYGVARTNTLGPASGWVLSDMIHDLGPQRFAEFWRSSDSVPAAFASAAHEPLDDWLYRWATRTYGRDVRGPWVEARAPVAGLVVVILALLVAAGFARERRVT
jgi:hypothetical protein